MKFSFLILLILLASCSHYSKLAGAYYSDRQDCFLLNDENSIMEKKDRYTDNLDVKQTDNKLKFYWVTRSPHKLLFSRNVEKYFFKILYKTEDSFMVSPTSALAKKYYDNRDSIVFKTKYRFADPTNYFNKIIFHSSHCFGCCKDLHLELDYSGNLKVTDKGSGYRGCVDSILNDNYFGKVSYADMERLKNIMKYTQLKTVEWPYRGCHDAPDLTLILYQNDKRYYFKTNALCLPIVSRELTGFLSRLFKYETLKKVDTTFTYED